MNIDIATSAFHDSLHYHHNIFASITERQSLKRIHIQMIIVLYTCR